MNMKPATLVHATRIASWLAGERRRWRRVKHLEPAAEEYQQAAQHFVRGLLDLGPAFVKLGQVLSTRPDFLPRPYIDALAILHEHVPPVPFDAVASVCRTELGQSVDEAFARFDRTPIASASLAQVHLAELPDGRPVAVKVQRPGIRELVERDLRALGILFRLVAAVFRRLARNLDLLGAYREFESYTRRELDFRREAQTLLRFRENFRGWSDVVFPEPELTTERVLTMQRVDGLRVHEVSANMAPEMREQLNQRIVEMLMKMFISDGFFHADLHPGNIFFGADGRIFVLDVGMVGELTEMQRSRFLLYWLAIAYEDRARALNHLEQLTRPGPRADRNGFRDRFYQLLDAFYAATISERSWTQTFVAILAAAARCGYHVPSEMLLEAKALTTAEALGFVLYSDARFAHLARPFISREFARLASSDNIRRRLSRDLPEWLLLGESAPPAGLENLSGLERWHDLWGEVAREWSNEMEQHPYVAKEIVHGEAEVIVEKPLREVFHFVTRLARYEAWHPTYTPDSRVIHVGGEWIFLVPEKVGSVFRLDEIADGFHVQSNGVVTEFEPYRRFKWMAPLSLMPLIYIGTCFSFEALDANRTRLHEYFYYLENDLVELFRHRPWLAALEALKHHIFEELSGCRHILESGQFEQEDLTDLWADVNGPTRVAKNYLRPTSIADGPRFG
jgi:predicted unusual protein kinase regulating ubiquinone biosynthesis (AarF/ABC1/UbiB family)